MSVTLCGLPAISRTHSLSRAIEHLRRRAEFGEKLECCRAPAESAPLRSIHQRDRRTRWPGRDSFRRRPGCSRRGDFRFPFRRRFGPRCMETPMAEIALFGNTTHAGRDIRIQQSSPCPPATGIPPVEIPRVIRARSHAVTASKATLRDLSDDSGRRVRSQRHFADTQRRTGCGRRIAGMVIGINTVSGAGNPRRWNRIHTQPCHAGALRGFLLGRRDVVLHSHRPPCTRRILCSGQGQ